MRTALLLLAATAWCQDAPPEPLYKFGTTVVATIGFKGQVYHLDLETQQLPNFRKMKPVGAIYTPYLYVLPQDFAIGFPGVTKRFEWFAIDYTGRFWVSRPGRYDFALLSDDGSVLFIDGKMVIDNDGIHGVLEKEGTIKLDVGVHRVRVSYFQGPRFHVALVLRIWPPEVKGYRIFNLEDYKPPADAPGWSDADEDGPPAQKGKRKK